MTSTKVGSTRARAAGAAGVLAACLASAACGTASPAGIRAEAGSTPSAGIRAPAATSDKARAECERAMHKVVRAEMWTVGALRRVGPDPMPSRSLLGYPAAEPVALCLVPQDGGRFTAVAVLSDGSQRPVWDQAGGAAFVPPA